MSRSRQTPRGAATRPSSVADGLQQATFQATAGVTYHFMVADYLFSGGGENLVFQLQ